MNVLSLFDGMSCGQQALERAGIPVTNYYASEIDKYAITVTMANYPNTIQLGSVVRVDGYKLPKIDLLIGGSPCQSFSFAGKRKGMATKCETEILTLEHYLELKAEGYEFEGQSYLFWEYMRLLNEVKPTYFLLENVEMGEKWEKVLSRAIGVNGIHINSALVSAQNRKRIYWTNIGMIPSGLFGDLESIIQQPKDKGILLKDILETEVDEKYYLSEKVLTGIFNNKRLNQTIEKHKNNLKDGILLDSYNQEIHKDKSITISTRVNASSCTHIYTKVDKKGNIKDNQEKASCFTAAGHSGGNHSDMDLIVHNTMPRSSTSDNGGTGPLSKADGKTYCLDTGNTNAVEVRGIIQHIIPEIVSVRKYEVNILALQDCLKQHKKLTNKEIADALNVPKTMVEHWFRTDTYFSIPDKENWFKLKKLFEINTNEFDESIMTFEEKESVFEKKNRVYDENGIAPTLTSTSADERILVREVKQLSTNNKSNGGTQPYQQDRIYDIDGISPALYAFKSDLLITSGTLRTHKDGEGFREVQSGKGATIPARAREDGSGQNVVAINSRIRRLTPTECERLQTVADNYTNHVSDSQRYKMLGNGWTVDVIAYIFSYIV
jgi:DNA-cytosine methyltransferase